MLNIAPLDAEAAAGEASEAGEAGEAGAAVALHPPRRAPRPWPLTVLKIGGSVLRGPADAAKVATEAYRVRRRGGRVVVVVSAIAGHTDALHAEAKAAGCAYDNRFTPHLVALGEARAAALAAMACERIGLRAAVLSPDALGLRAEGPREAAGLVSVDARILLDALDDHDVAVVPGYVACDAHGQPVLLGRGGTDFTALFLADALEADEVRLVKDVAGVFDRDPAVHGEAAQLYDALSWSDAKAVAGRLVQPAALAFAERRRLGFEVAAFAGARATRVGAFSAPAQHAPRARRIRVALAGCGVVGAGVAERLLAEPALFELTGVLVRDPGRPRDVALDPALLTDDPDVLFAARPDVLVDVVSDAEAGRGLMARAFDAGVHVVSADKQALADALEHLTARADVSGAAGGAGAGARLAYSAAVGGGCAMLETVRAARAHGPVVAFEAVLNGTVNFVLGRLAAGADLDRALDEARSAGFAEADASADLEGRDAAAKLRLLAYEAFGAVLPESEVALDALDAPAAARIGAAGFKQVSACRRVGDDLEAEVRLRPAAACAGPLASATRERNAIRVVTADGKVWTAEGRGAGRWPTTEAVLGDLLDMRAGLLDA